MLAITTINTKKTELPIVSVFCSSDAGRPKRGQVTYVRKDRLKAEGDKQPPPTTEAAAPSTGSPTAEPTNAPYDARWQREHERSEEPRRRGGRGRGSRRYGPSKRDRNYERRWRNEDRRNNYEEEEAGVEDDYAYYPEEQPRRPRGEDRFDRNSSHAAQHKKADYAQRDEVEKLQGKCIVKYPHSPCRTVLPTGSSGEGYKGQHRPQHQCCTFYDEGAGEDGIRKYACYANWPDPANGLSKEAEKEKKFKLGAPAFVPKSKTTTYTSQPQLVAQPAYSPYGIAPGGIYQNVMLVPSMAPMASVGPGVFGYAPSYPTPIYMSQAVPRISAARSCRE
jgi:hypothetical protein